MCKPFAQQTARPRGVVSPPRGERREGGGSRPHHREGGGWRPPPALQPPRQPPHLTHVRHLQTSHYIKSYPLSSAPTAAITQSESDLPHVSLLLGSYVLSSRQFPCSAGSSSCLSARRRPRRPPRRPRPKRSTSSAVNALGIMVMNDCRNHAGSFSGDICTAEHACEPRRNGSDQLPSERTDFSEWSERRVEVRAQRATKSS